MSRIGKLPITIPAGVEYSLNGNVVSIKGKKGTLTQDIDLSSVSLSLEENVLTIARASESPNHRSKHGLYRALIQNMIVGVTEGFKKQMEVVGVGYRANANGQLLELALGFSHQIVFEIPKEVVCTTVTEKGKAPIVTLESHDKQLLGAVAAKIRSFRKPEPYKGKGIKFVGEEIRRKAGKSAGKK
jgi:large subunit ribosomal protein L6